MKGCRKDVILIKGREGELFEEAYFIVRETDKKTEMRDIVEEACRIIETHDLRAAPASIKLNRKKKLIWFGMGILIACVMWGAGLIWGLTL